MGPGSFSWKMMFIFLFIIIIIIGHAAQQKESWFPDQMDPSFPT